MPISLPPEKIYFSSVFWRQYGQTTSNLASLTLFNILCDPRDDRLIDRSQRFET